jgi:hypothetical protein
METNISYFKDTKYSVIILYVYVALTGVTLI